ncbi:MAG: thioesterase family protein [Deferrisomatales bacterium]
MTERFPVVARIDVRWRDVDALGHVNNAVWFTYFEIARTRYYEQVLGARGIDDIDFLVASIRCDFRSPVVYGEAVEVGISIPWVGRTSYGFAYEARVAGDGRLAAQAESVQVLFDHARGVKLPVSPEWKERVARAQGAPPPPRAGP